MMILIFNANDKSFHMSSNRINKFYLNNDDFIIKEVSEFDEDYNYTLVENEVVKGDKIVLSDEWGNIYNFIQQNSVNKSFNNKIRFRFMDLLDLTN